MDRTPTISLWKPGFNGYAGMEGQAPKGVEMTEGVQGLPPA